MQRFGRSLIECLRTAAALRVGAPSSSAALHELTAAAAAEAQAVRWSSSAAVSSAGSAAGGAAVAAAAGRPSRLTLHQAQKAECRPLNSGRNAFRRGWARRLQTKWNAQERSANQAAARQRQHEVRLQQFKQRAQWAAERQAAQA